MKTDIALYQLADEYIVALEKLQDLDLPEQVVADTLEGLAGELETKATSVAAFVRNLESAAEQIKSAEERMAARRKHIEARAEHVRAYLCVQMLRTNIKRIDSPWFSIALRQNPGRVLIEGEVPAHYLVQPPAPPPHADKRRIAEDLKDGIDVPGARLDYSYRVDIK